MRLDKFDISEIGNYIVLNQINPERNSKTYQVKHKFTEELCVLKVVFADSQEDLLKLERTFKRLSLAIAKLHNPNIIKFKEFFITKIQDINCFVLVSEFFKGQELDGFLIKNGERFSYDQLSAIFLDVCSAVEAAHSSKFLDDYGVESTGFPHGDITPKNILINTDLKLKLLDFKLSNRFTVSDEKSEYEKLSVIVPEQKNSQVISKSSDIFQLGYLLKYLFSNDKNYRAWKLEEKSEKEIYDKLEPRKTNKKQKEIARIIHACTRENPEDRFNSVDQILSILNGNKDNIIVKSSSTKKYSFIAASVALLLCAGFFISKNLLRSVPAQELSEASRGVKPTVQAEVASAEKVGDYYALMIGNEEYKNLKQLTRPIQDLTTFENILVSKYNFKQENIIKKTNASRDDMYDGFEQVTNRVKKNDNLLIFYAGHGQIHEETGYWIPVEGHESSRRDWISNVEIKHFLNSIIAQNVLVVSDACFGGSILRDINTYAPKKENISNKKSRIALTSGSVESVPDHSIFIDQLFWYMENTQDSMVYASNIFSEIREGILSNTTNDPGYGPIRDSGHQGGDFFFIKQ